MHNDYTYEEPNENTHSSALFESLFIEIWRKNSKYQKYIIGNIYRLPTYLSADMISFINEYTAPLNILRTQSKFVYVCGDYNIDLLKMNSNEDFSTFYENAISSGFVPKITLPTRICDTTSTLIDNTYTNVLDKNHASGILVRPISDHQMYICNNE